MVKDLDLAVPQFTLLECQPRGIGDTNDVRVFVHVRRLFSNTLQAVTVSEPSPSILSGRNESIPLACNLSYDANSGALAKIEITS